MRTAVYWLLFIQLLFAGRSVIAQAPADTLNRLIGTYAETGALLTAGTAVPFWLRANQYGVVPLQGSLGTLRVGHFMDYKANRAARLDWGYGLEIVGNTGWAGQQVWLPQGYLKARWRQLELYVGRRKTIIGLVDTLLTSGAYAMSGNALPLPTIQLGTLGYVSLPFTKGIFSFYATYGHAWFETVNRKVEHTLLHQATFYLRLGKASWPIRGLAGINHQVIWGGYSPYLGNDLSNNGYLPSSFKAYLYAVTALPYADAAVDGNVTSFDETNRVGNHLGSLDLALEFRAGGTTFLLYRQNPYDTGAIWYLTTIADGLNGLSIRRQRSGKGWFSIERGLFEFLYTQNQGGNQFVITDPYQRGKVNYFNNGQYIDSWTTRAHTIGTPFLTPEGDIRSSLPYGPVINNRVALWHLGLSGRAGQSLSWLLKLSVSRNLGTYDAPFSTVLGQTSGLLQLSTPLRLPALGAFQLTSAIAIDQGDLLTNSSGVLVSLRRSWPSNRFTKSTLQPLQNK